MSISSVSKLFFFRRDAKLAEAAGSAIFESFLAVTGDEANPRALVVHDVAQSHRELLLELGASTRVFSFVDQFGRRQKEGLCPWRAT